MTREEFIAFIEMMFPDNIKREITEAKLRDVSEKMANLCYDSQDIASSAAGTVQQPITPSSAAPTITNGYWAVTIPGTYTNFGNVVLPENNFGFIFKNGSSFTIQSVEMPMQDLTSLENRVTENENKVDDFIENYAVEIDQEFNENSTNAIANDVVTKRTSLLERLEDEATEIIEGEGELVYNKGFTEFKADHLSYFKGNGLLRNNNVFSSISGEPRVVFQNIPIEENTKILVTLSNVVSTPMDSVYLIARNKSTQVWDVLISEKVSSTSSTASATISNIYYDIYSVMSYNNSTVFNVKKMLLNSTYEKFDKNYLYDKLNNSGSYANPIGKLIDVATISLPYGYSTFYYPWIIETKNIENPKGKFYLYFSTDHAGVNGKIGMFYSDDLVSWTFYGTVIQASTFGWVNAECETPTVLWIEEVKKFYCYFQTNPSRGGLGYAQATQIAESADGITWTWVKEAFNITMNKMKGDGHNGYFVCQKINGIYKGVSLFGGTDIDFRATHFSKDGLNWITHQKEAQAVYTSSFFWRENSLCKVSNYDIVSESGAGGVAGSYKKFILSYVDEDLEVIGQGDVLGNIIPSGEGQVVSSLATNVIEGQVYLSAVFSKNKIVIKKIV